MSGLAEPRHLRGNDVRPEKFSLVPSMYVG
jgi:hypothetical protein